jgi:hypothetical protein
MSAQGLSCTDDPRARRGLRLRYSAAVVLLLLTSLIAQGACLPHTHSGVGAGVYNAEHDLTLLAASGTVVPLPAVPSLFVAIVTAPVVCILPPTPISVASRDADSRAPPTA